MPNKPAQPFQYVREWFKKCGDRAANMGKHDSAALWRDGLAHLDAQHASNVELTTALRAMLDDYNHPDTIAKARAALANAEKLK
jgi:hypothetical protein